jgi:hypothetical protein
MRFLLFESVFIFCTASGAESEWKLVYRDLPRIDHHKFEKLTKDEELTLTAQLKTYRVRLPVAIGNPLYSEESYSFESMLCLKTDIAHTFITVYDHRCYLVEQHDIRNLNDHII